MILAYAARTRAGFVPALRQSVFTQFRAWISGKWPFVNLTERGTGHRGEGLTAEGMEYCRWLKPLIAAVEFLEWMHDNQLRHPNSVALRNDIDPRQ